MHRARWAHLPLSNAPELGGQHAKAGCHVRWRLEGAPALLDVDDFISRACGSHGRFPEQEGDTVSPVQAPVEKQD